MDYVLTGIASKQVDSYCIKEVGIPSLALMERAALAVADETLNYLKDTKKQKKQVFVISMPGNNGADGLAAARMIREKGYFCRVCVIGSLSRATEEFLVQLNIIKQMDIEIILCDTEESVKTIEIPGDNVIIDALFGIGLSREVSGMYAEIIKKINESENYVISVDIASGLNPATGSVMGVAVDADKTVTFGTRKAGQLLGEGKAYSGEVVVKDVGFVKHAYEKVVENNPSEVYECFTVNDLKRIPKRIRTSNKGTYGTVHVIGGGADMSGAAALSATAAYRCGAGLVKVYAKENNLNALKILIKEAVILGFSDFDKASISEQKDIVIIGPGLSVTEETIELVREVLTLKCKIVLDADALNVISQNRMLLECLNENVVITPHVKEMARLTDKDTDYIRKNIVQCAREFSMEHSCVTVIKDAAAVISSAEGKIKINTTGNSGMSKGGSGDILTGIIAGLISQNLSVYEAAGMGVYLHGIAGDYAAAEKSEYSLLASDLLEKLPEVFRLRMENQ